MSAFCPTCMCAELRLLEIGGDPDFIERHDGEQLLAGLNIHADDDGLIHFAADRGDDFGVAEIELRLIE